MLDHLKLYAQIRNAPPRPPRELAPDRIEYAQLEARALKAESAERDAWAHYRSVEVNVRTALLSAEYLNSPQAEARYTILEGQRYTAESRASTASGRAREARRQEMVASHERACHGAARAFYEGAPGGVAVGLGVAA